MRRWRGRRTGRYRDRVRFRDLGPFTVEEDGVPVPLSGQRLAAVLALLVANARSSVPTSRIVHAVWGEHPPARPGAALDSLLWRLRRALEPGRPPRGVSTLLQNTDSGYRLAVPDDDIDSRGFLLDAQRAAAALRDGDSRAALRSCDAALERWRGLPFTGIPDSDWLLAERERLQQVRGDLSENRVQALLELGHPEQAAAAAGRLLPEHPYRERLWAQRILGLYRTGRQADALATFEQARLVLSDELGIDPGPELTRLHTAVLAQDPDLLPERPVSAPAAARPRVRAPLLLGRDEDLATARRLLNRGRLLTLAGPMGVGKTALATAIAAETDDAVFVDLTATADAAGLVQAVLASLRIGPAAGDPLTTLLERLRHRPVLLVLDNCEQLLTAARDLTEDMLSATSRVRVLVTSREPLDVPAEQVHRLGPLPAPMGVALFERRWGAAADDAQTRLIGEICSAVDGLPLGIELAARRARAFSLDEIKDSVRRDPGGLARDPRSPRADRTLTAAIEASHRMLSPPEQRAHRRLSVLAGPFTLEAAAGVLDVDRSAAMDLLAALAHRSMLSAEPRPQASTRFRQLVPLRADGGQRLAAAGEVADVQRFRTTWLRGLVQNGPGRGRAGQRQWYQTVDDDWASVVATIDTELAPPGEIGAFLAIAVQGYCYDRNRTPQAVAWMARAAELPGLDAFARAAVDTAYGSVLILTRQGLDGLARLEAGVAALGHIVDENPVLAAGLVVDAAACCWAGDHYAHAERLAALAHDLAVQADCPHEAELAETIGIAASLFTHDPATAAHRAEALLDSGQLAHNGQATLFASATAGIAAIATGDAEAGLRWTERSLRTAQHMGALNLGGLLEQRAGHLARAGRLHDAVRCLAASAAHARHLGEPWPAHAGTSDLHTHVRRHMADDDYLAAHAAGERIITAHGIDIADWL